MSLVGLPLLPGLLFLLLSKSPIAPLPPVMFRGDPAHTGVAAGTLFDGQGGVRWRARDRGYQRRPDLCGRRRHRASPLLGDHPYHLFPAGKWDLWASSPAVASPTSPSSARWRSGRVRSRGAGGWRCGPLQIDEGGYVDLDLTVEGTCRLEPQL